MQRAKQCPVWTVHQSHHHCGRWMYQHCTISSLQKRLGQRGARPDGTQGTKPKRKGGEICPSKPQPERAGEKARGGWGCIWGTQRKVKIQMGELCRLGMDTLKGNTLPGPRHPEVIGAEQRKRAKTDKDLLKFQISSPASWLQTWKKEVWLSVRRLWNEASPEEEAKLKIRDLEMGKLCDRVSHSGP